MFDDILTYFCAYWLINVKEARLGSEQIFSGNARNGLRPDAGPLLSVLVLQMRALHSNNAQVFSLPARKSFKITLKSECRNR